jgi:hypothetical protein
VIDNFEPQPFPLEASAEAGTWMLVIGWQRTGDGRLDPVLVSADGPLMTVSFPAELRYRLADTRPIGGRAPAPASASTVQPARRERRAEAT